MSDTTLFPTTVRSSTPTIEDLTALFGWEDYLVFGLMLVASAGIGLYYGCKSRKDDTKSFLMAGNQMTTFPVSMSLIASFMSAVTLLGTPSEVYQNGFVYWLIGFCYLLVMPSAAYLYLPVFWNLNIKTSAYEYLEMRFHPYVRRLGSMVFILQMVLYMAIVVYAPSLALAQVTGLNLYLSISLICFVSMFYTTLGGLKAVLWTDTLQVIIMYVTMIFIVLYGTFDVGGFSYVWQKAVESGRADLVDWDPNPTTRHTFWTLVIGGYFTWITIYGCNQAQVQRYLSCKKLHMVRRALFINAVGLFLLMLVCAYGGLVIYAKFYDCDPIRSEAVSAADQLFPYFVMQTVGTFSGLPGLFVAGIFSGALSTVASGLNALSAIVLTDFLRPFKPEMSDRTATLISRVLSITFGLITFGLVFVAQMLGDVLSAALSIFGMVGGPLLGMFTLGMFFPWANAIGCFIGTIVSLVFVFFIGVGYQVASGYGIITIEPKPTSVAGCAIFVNETMEPSPTDDYNPMWESPIFELSYLWYSATGCFTVIVIGLLVSFITGKQNVRTLNPKTLSPAIFWFQRFIPGLSGLGEDFIDLPEVRRSKVDSNSVSLDLDNPKYENSPKYENKDDKSIINHGRNPSLMSEDIKIIHTEDNDEFKQSETNHKEDNEGSKLSEANRTEDNEETKSTEANYTEDNEETKSTEANRTEDNAKKD